MAGTPRVLSKPAIRNQIRKVLGANPHIGREVLLQKIRNRTSHIVLDGDFKEILRSMTNSGEVKFYRSGTTLKLER